ncbi:hypothetical protein BV881_22850 [Streptomyces sp. ZL-24]|nr:hypothetical protein BV881_22850 [Streptomyces sp. ZL-24]
MHRVVPILQEKGVHRDDYRPAAPRAMGISCRCPLRLPRPRNPPPIPTLGPVTPPFSPWRPCGPWR